MFLDVLISFLFVGGGFRGFRKGTVLQFISLMLLLLSIYVISIVLGWFSSMHFFAAFIGFVLILGFCFGIHVFTRFLEKFFEQQNYSQTFFLFGGLFGMIRYGFIMSVMLCIISQYNYVPPVVDGDVIAPVDTTKVKESFYEKTSKASYLYVFVRDMAPFIFQDLILENKNSIDEIKKSNLDIGIIPLQINKSLHEIAKDSGRVEWRVLEKEYHKDSLLCGMEAKVALYKLKQKKIARFRFVMTKYLKVHRATRAELREFLVNEKPRPVSEGQRALIRKRVEW